MTAFLNRQAAIFSAKCFLAAIMALYIALRTSQSDPSWAIVTTYVVAQSRAGAVVSKSVFRVIGTIIGAAASVFMVPPLVNAPELLSGAVALWLGLCAFLSLIDKTSRSYAFMLAGYTACIVVFPSVNQPDAIFDVAIARVQEITLGILCGTIVHAVILPSSSADLLRERLDGVLSDAARWTVDALSIARPETLDNDRRRLATRINDLYDLLLHTGYELGGASRQRRVYLALLAQMERMLPLLAAVDDRVMELRRSGTMGADVEAFLEEVSARVSTSFGAGPGDHADLRRLRYDCRRFEPSLTSGFTWHQAILLNLFARLSDLVQVQENCLALRSAIVSEPRSPKERRRISALLETKTRAMERDYTGALLTAMCTGLALFCACLLWITSAWKDGGTAVLNAGIFFSIYSSSTNPTALLRNKLVGVGVRTLLAIVYVLVIIPSIDGFVMFAAALAPVLLISGAAMTVPRYAPLGFNLILGVLSPAIISIRFVPDFAAYLNGAIASLTGIYFALLMMTMMQTLWLGGAIDRLLQAGWDDIGRARYESRAHWRSRMEHRLALLATHTAQIGAVAPHRTADAFRDLMTGLALGELAGLRDRLVGQGIRGTQDIINQTADYYRSLDRKGALDPPTSLRDRIDEQLRLLMPSSDRRGERQAIVALAGLRRNLFP
ncbi:MULTISPECIES: FUSC family protein [Sphingobium]|jgi:uncharacterized membrane protein YccC|uniref:FUSC family protein n=2 Tax=Sphingobium TaxID=165695 RepID=A0A5B8CCL7_SPHSA|nr:MULTISPECIES: FUSC family protein [Sphingobium]QDC36585.1 FUSC family protein [Sphingobium fuliginis ATCC 27551]QNG43927.1 FUSC family protein [Sphingobium yanoikuyae]